MTDLTQTQKKWLKLKDRLSTLQAKRQLLLEKLKERGCTAKDPIKQATLVLKDLEKTIRKKEIRIKQEQAKFEERWKDELEKL